MCSAWGTAGYVSDGSWSGTYVPVPNTPSPGQVITKKYPGYQEKVPKELQLKYSVAAVTIGFKSRPTSNNGGKDF